MYLRFISSGKHPEKSTQSSYLLSTDIKIHIFAIIIIFTLIEKM